MLLFLLSAAVVQSKHFQFVIVLVVVWSIDQKKSKQRWCLQVTKQWVTQ